MWDVEQLRTFVQHVEFDRWFALWLLYATTGLRRGEALGQTWEQVNLDGGTVRVD